MDLRALPWGLDCRARCWLGPSGKGSGRAGLPAGGSSLPAGAQSSRGAGSPSAAAARQVEEPERRPFHCNRDTHNNSSIELRMKLRERECKKSSAEWGEVGVSIFTWLEGSCQSVSYTQCWEEQSLPWTSHTDEQGWCPSLSSLCCPAHLDTANKITWPSANLLPSWES